MTQNTWYSGCGRIAITPAPEAIDDCSGPGRADEAIAYWEPRTRIESALRDTPDPDETLIAEILGEYSDWDCSDPETNRQRLVWIACGDLAEAVK